MPNSMNEYGSVQWPCNDRTPPSPVAWTSRTARPSRAAWGGSCHAVCTDRRKVTPKFAAAHHRTDFVAIQRRRTDPSYRQQRLALSKIGWIFMRKESAALPMAMGARVLRRATVVAGECVQPGVYNTPFHFPELIANVVTTDNSDWATNCPEYKVAVGGSAA